MRRPLLIEPARGAGQFRETDGSALAGPATGVTSASRFEFANQLRGLAALCVVVSHLLGVFWLMQDVLAMTTLAPAQGGPVPALVTATNWEWFAPGPFGVGLFFLISGFVVPISLTQHTTGSFLAARALRIYPTYLVGFGLQLLVLWTASRIWGHQLPYDWQTILANALLITDILGRPSIDMVNWTLTIELRFYILIAALAPLVRRGHLAAVLGVPVVACVCAFGLSQSVDVLTLDGASLLFAASLQLPFLTFMFIGVAFNYHVRGKLGASGLIGTVAALSTATAFVWWFSVIRGQFTHVMNDYFYALLVFATAYIGRRSFSPNRLIDGLASISYPLYLIHALLGYFVLKCLMLLAGVGYFPALAAALLATFAVATTLHVTIERASIGWGRRLGSGLAGR